MPIFNATYSVLVDLCTQIEAKDAREALKKFNELKDAGRVGFLNYHGRSLFAKAGNEISAIDNDIDYLRVEVKE